MYHYGCVDSKYCCSSTVVYSSRGNAAVADMRSNSNTRGAAKRRKLSHAFAFAFKEPGKGGGGGAGVLKNSS